MIKANVDEFLLIVASEFNGRQSVTVAAVKLLRFFSFTSFIIYNLGVIYCILPTLPLHFITIVDFREDSEMPLFPPLNFCAVAENLYRSAIPNELNFQFLQTLNIQTVVVLQSPEEVDDRL
jgi:hypothetical protein